MLKIYWEFLYPSEDIWYLGTSANWKNVYPKNIENGIVDNKIKCNSKYKYCLDEKYNNKKIRLNKNEKCPRKYNYLAQDKSQCVKNYSDINIVFDSKFLQNCPMWIDEETTESGKSCKDIIIVIKIGKQVQIYGKLKWKISLLD